MSTQTKARRIRILKEKSQRLLVKESDLEDKIALLQRRLEHTREQRQQHQETFRRLEDEG